MAINLPTHLSTKKTLSKDKEYTKYIILKFKKMFAGNLQITEYLNKLEKNNKRNTNE